MGKQSCGPLVDLLVRSGVSRYLEFKSLQNAYMQLEQGFKYLFFFFFFFFFEGDVI